MQRLGYTRYAAQGGDWGNAVTEQMALQRPAGLLAIHTNMPATIPDDIAKALQFGGAPPSGLSADESYAYDQLDFFYKHGVDLHSNLRLGPIWVKSGTEIESGAAFSLNLSANLLCRAIRRKRPSFRLRASRFR